MSNYSSMDQSVLDRVVRIATNAAMNGRPVESIIWHPPQNADSNPDGVFFVKCYENLSATDTQP